MRDHVTEANTRFDSPCSQARRELAFVERSGQVDTLKLSAEQCQPQEATHDRTRRDALKNAFRAEFGDWIAEQNARLEARGIPAADLRPW
jgi:hypothetical protein